jgi:hypothetical protein
MNFELEFDRINSEIERMLKQLDKANSINDLFLKRSKLFHDRVYSLLARFEKIKMKKKNIELLQKFQNN